ncbi:unnamed protein product [Dibothriocephalus latus]|uniref:Uncharacterized protein n=1 Tax=Dibothriocephalus latus TaxID=60516 RepID=A0A3P6TL24_DIBLA|nr:unnamed protein product [Dibothriocephalus latus]
MDDQLLPKRLFYGDVAEGARRNGGPKRRYTDTLKNSTKRLQIHMATWEELAQDRSTTSTATTLTTDASLLFSTGTAPLTTPSTPSDASSFPTTSAITSFGAGGSSLIFLQ